MNILWLYDTPLIPEAGGTERMTSLIAKGLTHDGHICLGQIVVMSNKSFILNQTVITDLYSFLRDYEVDYVINQECRHNELLKHFLESGGAQWHKEGGKIISCLHFDTRITDTVYHYKVKLNKGLRDYISLFRAYLNIKSEHRAIDQRLGLQYRWCYNHSDYFITLSEKFNPYFRQVTQLTEAPKLKTINNPLTFSEIASLDSLGVKKKVVLICARMSEYQKRISFALKAWSKIKKHSCATDWTLKVVGTGEDLEKYIKITTNNRIPDVSFEGRKNSEPYYDEASIFLMTSGFEGWGLTLTESIQKGVVPVVMDSSAVFSDIIQHGYNGYLTKNNNITDLVNHVIQLMSDTRRLEAMQRNALNSADKFTLEKTMEKWREIIPPIKL